MNFVGVAWVGDDMSFQDFIDRHGITFPNLSDDDGEVFARFEVPSQPALVVIDTDGEIQQVFNTIDEGLLHQILSDVTG